MDWIVAFFSRLWPGTITHVIILVIVVLLAWLASPGDGFPMALITGVASLAARALLADNEQAALAGEA